MGITTMVSWELVFAIIPGIILFLYGIEQFSREVQLAAGEYLRNIIQRLTQTPVRAGQPLAPEQRDKPGASSSQQETPENNEVM